MAFHESIAFLPYFIATFVLVIAPGLLIARFISTKGKLDSAYVVPLALLSVCLIGYVGFWLYLFSSNLGRAYTWFWFFATVISVFLIFLKRKSFFKLEILIPLVLLFAVAFFYSTLTLSCTVQQQDQSVNRHCSLHGITFDDIMPQIYATNVYNHHPKALIGDWQSSDRPPLQSGLVLIFSPVTITGQLHDMGYEILAIIAQCFWVPTIWLFSGKLRRTQKQRVYILAFCIFSGFFFFNSVFAWPKLLAGSLVLLAFSLMFFEKKSYLTWVLAALACALGFLSHSSVIFTLVPMGIWALTNGYRPIWKIVSAAGLVFLMVCMPWLVYQKYYDPPGNRLLKWHIGGVEQIDSRSLGQAIHDSYARAGLKEVETNKLSNFTTLLGRIPPVSYIYTKDLLGRLRDAEFRYVIFGLGLLNTGWVVLFISLKRRKFKLVNERVKLMIGVAFSSLFLWALVMFGPNITVIHQGSYATIMLLFVSLSALICSLPKLFMKILLLIQTAYFIIVWGITVLPTGLVSRLFICYLVVGFALLLTSLFKIANYKTMVVNGRHHKTI